MPEVIADTSVIQYLYQCDYFFILPGLYKAVTIPLGVADELEKGREIGVALPKLADYVARVSISETGFLRRSRKP